MSGLNNAQQDVDIDLAQLFRAVWVRKARIVAITMLAASAAFVGSSLISPSYQTETRLLIEARSPSLTSNTVTGGVETQPLLDELNIVSQVQLLRSVDLIKQVARDLKLYELEEFDPDTNPSALSDILVLVGLKKNPLDLAPEDRVVKTFQEKLQVYQVEKSRVIGIQFTSKDPQLAAAIPNKMAEVYQSLQSGAKLDTTTEAARWLEPEIANLRDKVREAEQKVAEYRANSGLLKTSETQNFSTQQLNDISLELARVRGQRADAEATAQSVRAALKAGKPTDTLEAVVSSPVVQKLKESESGIRSQLNDLSTTLLDGHPRLKALRAQLSGIQEQIRQESARVASSLENEAGVARLREEELIRQLNQIKAESARAGEEEVGLKALEREATAQRQLLETYLARYREASSRLEMAASPADARVISRASEPLEPSFPKVIPITIVVTLASLILNAVVIMLMELFSGRAFRPVAVGLPRQAGVEDERASIVTAPASAKVLPPELSSGPASMLDVEPDDELVEEMVASVAPLVPSEEGAEFSVESVARYLIESETSIAFSISPSGDDGSTAAVMLAREVAEGGRRVILVDMTGSGCPTSLMATDRGLPGITDLLCGEADFADVMHADRLSDAHIVPQGTSDIRRAMRGADRLSIIIDALSGAYDLVLVECGPANAEGVARLSRNGRHEIVLSAPDPDPEALIAIMDAFDRVGYSDLILMTTRPSAVIEGLGRRAA